MPIDRVGSVVGTVVVEAVVPGVLVARTRPPLAPAGDDGGVVRQ
eukprot:gene22886-7245_t